MAVKKNDIVKMNFSYCVKNEDSKLSSNKTKEPVQFQVGNGEVIKGIEEAVIGMKKGEKKKVTVNSDKAFGDHNEELVQQVAFELIKDRPVKEGDFIELKTAEGEIRHAKIVSIAEDTVLIDLNHPLAGKTLDFEIEIVDIEK